MALINVNCQRFEPKGVLPNFLFSFNFVYIERVH